MNVEVVLQDCHSKARVVGVSSFLGHDFARLLKVTKGIPVISKPADLRRMREAKDVQNGLLNTDA